MRETLIGREQFCILIAVVVIQIYRYDERTKNHTHMYQCQFPGFDFIQ